MTRPWERPATGLMLLRTRDLLVFFVWERGFYTNREIDDIFGITYTAVSHIVKQVKARIGTDRDFQKDYALINSQIKM
jgi:hypothetical protein